MAPVSLINPWMWPSVDYRPNKLFALMVTSADLRSADDETSMAFPSSLTNRAIECLIATFLRQEENVYMFDLKSLAKFDVLDCHITPMPADTEAELTTEMSVNAIAVAARAGHEQQQKGKLG